MKDYKRLTKRSDEGTYCIVAEEIAKEMAVWQEQHATGELAPLPLYHLGTRLCRLEDKIENGTLIELPCKVGDTVYAPHWHCGEWDKIVPYQITNITVTQNKKLEWTKKYRAMELVEGKTIDWQLNFAFDEVGKKVFLTKAEAEAMLLQLKGDK